MLVNTPGTASILPGPGPECQPTTLMPAAIACSMIGACSAASIVPRMMPSGFSAIAWVSAEAAGPAVALIGRGIDDHLLALRLRAAGRAVPGRHRSRGLGNIVLGHLHEVIVGGLRADDM